MKSVSSKLGEAVDGDSRERESDPRKINALWRVICKDNEGLKNKKRNNGIPLPFLQIYLTAECN